MKQGKNEENKPRTRVQGKKINEDKDHSVEREVAQMLLDNKTEQK